MEKNNREDLRYESKIDEKRKREHENNDENKISQIRRTLDFLKYAAAALSIVSFLTTSSGLKNVLQEENHWQAYLISFGIQAIVLGVGMKLAEIISFIKERDQKTDSIFKFKRVISVVVAVLYVSSLVFSSFFSFVFLTNNAYKGTKESDYNMRIDEFMIKETRNLSNINYEIGRKLLQEIQANSADTSAILAEIAKDAAEGQKYIQDSITKNDKSSIDDIIFTASSIPEYDEIGERYSDNLKSLVDQAINRFQSFSQSYSSHYKKYVKYYDKFNNNPDYEQREGNLKELNNLRVGIENDIESIDSFVANTDGAYDTRIEQHRDSVKGAYNQLLSSVNELITSYENMKDNQTVEKGSISLSEFYKTVFSPESVNVDNVKKAYTTLQNIVAGYLESGKDLSDEEYEKIKKLSVCITYLGEFEKYKSLDDGIKYFEDNNLNKVLLIQETTTAKKTEKTAAADDKETTTTTFVKGTDESSESNNAESRTGTTAGSAESQTEAQEQTATAAEQESASKKSDKQEETSAKSKEEETTEKSNPISFSKVNKDEWNQSRKEDLSTFIRLVKELPDIEILMSNSDEFKSLKKHRDYAEETINDAYSLYRRNLEDISDVERAVNFMFSDHPFMAWFSLFVALFMDLSSCFIGLYDFYVQKREEEKREKEKAERERTEKEKINLAEEIIIEEPTGTAENINNL